MLKIILRKCCHHLIRHISWTLDWKWSWMHEWMNEKTMKRTNGWKTHGNNNEMPLNFENMKHNNENEVDSGQWTMKCALHCCSALKCTEMHCTTNLSTLHSPYMRHWTLDTGHTFIVIRNHDHWLFLLLLFIITHFQVDIAIFIKMINAMHDAFAVLRKYSPSTLIIWYFNSN